jgi:hypothetical protein
VAPGPNNLFVTVTVGDWQIAQLPGAIATTLGLALPARVFPVVVSRLSRLAQFERLLQALKRGLGPVALGLMESTVYLLLAGCPALGRGWRLPRPPLLLLTTNARAASGADPQPRRAPSAPVDVPAAGAMECGYFSLSPASEMTFPHCS